MAEIALPDATGAISMLKLAEPAVHQCARPGDALPRKALSAAHVVADPRADIAPFDECRLDMAATMRYREHLWDLGLGVAEAMDTAQRGMGLSWKATQEVIAETLALAATRPGATVYCGVGTDHLDDPSASLDDVVRAYCDQLAFVQRHGGRAILMASRALARAASGPADYARVYAAVLSQADRPVILHWLGPMFDPALAGYWGERDEIARSIDACLAIIADNAERIEGIKVSLLDKDVEIRMRRRLPSGCRMYTGDDFNYAELIAGDDQGHSDALLGIFDAIAPAASAALLALGRGDREGFHRILDPTVALSRELFRAPTRFYKTGIVFLAYLNGHQDHFAMVGGQQSARSVLHLCRLFRLADACGLLGDPDMAVARMKPVLQQNGLS